MDAAQTQDHWSFPPGGTGQGILVLHAWWGLNDFIRGFCRRVTQAGYLVHAPDLYHGRLATTVTEAERLAANLDTELTQREVVDAAHRLFAHELRTGQGVGVIGFSLGASFALHLSGALSEQVNRVVIFYGTGGSDFTRSKSSYLGHFAEDDPYESRAGVDALEASLRRAGRSAEFYQYPGTGHWFFEADRPEAFDPAAADLAWERTKAFFVGNPASL